VPKRSNLQQAVIYYVKRHLAPPEVEVTESKMLLDADSGEEREVDVVMEGMVGDESVVISVEVTANRRRADLPWVEAMLSKHARMPTTKLVLVSWSGFTAPALAKVDRQGGRVVALTPEEVPNVSVPSLFYLEVTSTQERAAVLVRNDDDTLTKVTNVPILLNLYSAADLDSFAFTLQDLVQRALNEGGGRKLVGQAYEHDDGDSLTHFSIGMDNLDRFGVYAHDGERFRLLSAFEVDGPVSVGQQPVEFTMMRLGDSLFAMTEVTMAGRSAVWVLTHDGEETATVSWRLLSP
jgi:hypothetical protein